MSASPALPSSVLRMSGSARLKHVVSALSLSDLHLNAAASVYLLWGEPVPHDWFWLIPSDFHVDLHHFILTLPPPWPCLWLERDSWRGNFCQKYVILHFFSNAAHLKKEQKWFTSLCVWRLLPGIYGIFCKMNICFNNTITPTFSTQIWIQTHCYNLKHNYKYSMKIKKTTHLEYFLETLCSCNGLEQCNKTHIIPRETFF